MSLVRIVCLSLALLGSVVAMPARADLRYTFDADAQGFDVNGDAGILTHVPEGYLRVQDATGDTNVSLIFPPGSHATGWLPYLGGTLSFDARLESAIDSYWPEFGTITLVSSLGSVAVDIAGDSEPGLRWKTYSVTLDADNWSAPAATWPTFLSTLQSVELSLEAGTGPIEVVYIDNVRLAAAVPEPESCLMVVAGLLAMVMLRQRQARLMAP